MSDLPPPPNPLLALRATNVSNPSIVHRKSEQSITASEDYYSLSSSSSSTHRPNDPSRSQATLARYVTPPSRYRTPAQSRDYLPAQPSAYDRPEASYGAAVLRGQGQRRQSADSGSSRERVAMPFPLHFREGAVRRKPVPSTVIERPESGPSPIQSRGTVIDERSNFNSPPTPGPYDQTYLRFALDQLTRDEDVRGSRAYAGPGGQPIGGLETDPFITQHTGPYHAQYTPTQGHEIYGNPFDDHIRQSRPRSSAQYEPREGDSLLGEEPQILEARHAIPISPPPRDPRRKSTPEQSRMPSSHQPPMSAQPATPNVFLPLSADGTRPLNFLPGTLRAAHLGLFALAILVYTVCLLIAAIWSVTHRGLWAYTDFGDGRYFLFRYFPTLLGTVLLLWLFHIQNTLTRIAPFIALSSSSPSVRSIGTGLPLHQTSYLMPSLHHFRAGQPVLGLFAVVAWLQLFTLPLLASSFNVHFFGAPQTGSWRWLATQGAIWPVIILYILLILLTLAMLVTLRRQRETGLKWDSRSLADLLVLLERSNSLSSESMSSAETPRLGLWRMSARQGTIFHTYGLANVPGRRYSLEDGRLREKTPVKVTPETEEKKHRPTTSSGSRDRECYSRDAMLPAAANTATISSTSSTTTSPLRLPWFLRPIFTSLWVIIAIMLLLAFLIVSYLPSTALLRHAFTPRVPAPVDRAGFSSTNFLYAFLPTLLAELCLLLWTPCELAHRRLTAFFGLFHNAIATSDLERSKVNNSETMGATAEHSLLLSYPAQATPTLLFSAPANSHPRLALLAFNTLLAATLPTLAGGIFWSQFYVPSQNVRIATHAPGFYALTVLLSVFALGWLLLLPWTSVERHLSQAGVRSGNDALSFQDHLALVRSSKILDDVAFHSPISKTDLVTRLLSAPAHASLGVQEPRVAESKTSLADSIRGYGGARQKALAGLGLMRTPHYYLGRGVGRDGETFEGIDRVR